MNRNIVIIEEIEVPVHNSYPVLLDENTYLREIALLTSESENRQNVSRSSECLLRAFKNYKTLASPTKPYPSYAGIRDPVFVYDYDKVIVLDTVAETSEIRRVNDKSRDGNLGFAPRTLISELRAWKKFRGENRSRTWSTVTSSKGERVQTPRDPVVRHCATEKCSTLVLSQGKWTSVTPEWAVDKPEIARLLPGDMAFLIGIKGFEERKDGESEIEYYARVRPSPKYVVESNGIVAPADADAFGANLIFEGFGYDVEYSRCLRRETDARAKTIETWEEADATPLGLIVNGADPKSETKRNYAKGRNRTRVDDGTKRRKAIQKKLEFAEKAEAKLAKTIVAKGAERGYVRVFDSFENMRRELYEGLRGKEFDPTPVELVEHGNTVQAIRKAAGTKISKEVAEDVLRGGKLLEVGDRVLLVDATGRRDIFEKSKDPDGELFWALKGTVAVSGIRPCNHKDAGNTSSTDSVMWDVCDIERERVKARAEAYKDAIEFIDGGTSAIKVNQPGTQESLRQTTLFYKSEGKYVPSTKGILDVTGYKYEVAGVNIPVSIDEVILHPEYRDGYTEAVSQSDSDTMMFDPNAQAPKGSDLGGDRDRDMDADRTSDFDFAREREFASDTVKSIISRAVDGMVSGASYDLVGINTRVLKNMVAFSVSPFSDLATGEAQEQKARTLRLITSTIQYVAVFVTMARQIVTVESRNEKDRDELMEIAITKSKTIDFSEFFPERKSLRAALDSKVTKSSLTTIYESELNTSPLLRDMLTRPPDNAYTITNAGKSLKNWVGFRPYISGLSRQDSDGFDELRKVVRKTSTTTAKSITGFNKRGRCCQEVIPPHAFDDKKDTKIDISDLKSFEVPKSIDESFVDDIKRSLRNAFRAFVRILAAKDAKRISLDENGRKVRAKPAVIAKTLKGMKTFVFEQETGFGDIAKRIDDNELRGIFTEIYKRKLTISASDNAEVSARMETAREDRKQMQVSYVESMDQESKTAYFAQREIGIKLDEVMEYEMQNKGDAEIDKDKSVDIADDSHEYGDYELVTIEDDGTS